MKDCSTSSKNRQDNPAKTDNLAAYDDMAKLIGIIAYDGVTLLDIAGPMQAFEAANILLRKSGRKDAYTVRTFARRAGLITTDVSLKIEAEEFCDIQTELLLVPGGPGVWDVETITFTNRIIKNSFLSGSEIASVCLGAFLLGHAGLLTGKRAVTHWRYCEKLANMFPQAKVHMDSIFVHDVVWTSAGVTAGIDLALAIIERDFGHSLAVEVSRRLVVYLKRSGGQSQYSQLLAAQEEAPDGRISDLHAWIADNLNRPLHLDMLADHIGMSKRNFARYYVNSTGYTPRVGVEKLRVDAAQRLLVDYPSLSIKRISTRCGFSDENHMRRAFKRSFGVGPAEMRQRF